MNPYLDIVIRSVSVYFFMIIALRVFGKKQLSQLNTADVILILLISNSVQNAMVGNNTSLYGGIVAALALFIINFGFKKVMSKSEFIKNLVQDRPEILIHNGKIEFDTISRLGITNDELQEAMREHGVEYYKEVKLAMFEIDGSISIISGDKDIKQTHHKRKIHKTLGTLNN
ncbi:MAG: YetF domain-containing protein [Flavobacterium sp.]